jgi:uncharacterized protein YciI
MKHFIVEIIYKAHIDKIEEVLTEHRNFLQRGYDEGKILMSGPQVPTDWRYCSCTRRINGRNCRFFFK